MDGSRLRDQTLFFCSDPHTPAPGPLCPSVLRPPCGQHRSTTILPICIVALVFQSLSCLHLALLHIRWDSAHKQGTLWLCEWSPLS